MEFASDSKHTTSRHLTSLMPRSETYNDDGYKDSQDDDNITMYDLEAHCASAAADQITPQQKMAETTKFESRNLHNLFHLDSEISSQKAVP